MFHRRMVSIESTCTFLSCTSDQFLDFYENENLSTNILAEDAQAEVIDVNRELLRSASQKCRFDDLLSAMLEHAPHDNGKRYVAVALHIAQNKGKHAVVEVAKAWLENLFLPMLSISTAIKTEPSVSQTPTIETTAQHIEPAPRSEQSDLRDKVATRESYRCAITQAFDPVRARALLQQGRQQEIPNAPQHRLEAAHIIPFLLNEFSSSANITPEIRDAAFTWDMFKSWTQIDIKRLVGSDINSPANAILMTRDDHEAFGRFQFYLDKEAYPDIPNKYLVRMSRDGLRLSSGQFSAEVEFRGLLQSGVESPDPEFLRVHAAFAKVLNLCGAAEYFENAERDFEKNVALFLNRETDFASLLTSKLMLVVH